MGASRLPKASGGPFPSSKAPNNNAQSFSRTSSRRVCFSEISTKNQNQAHWESGEEKKERRVCGLCCAWTSLIIGCFVLAFLVIGGMFILFLQNALPQFYVKGLVMTNLTAVTKDDQADLNADVKLLINATNRNDKYDLSYGLLKVEIWSENIKLGKAEVAPFKQSPRNMSVLKVESGVKNSTVNGEDAEELVTNYKERRLIINMVFRGSISFNFEGREVKRLPLTVECENIVLSEIDSGRQPECHVRMFKFI